MYGFSMCRYTPPKINIEPENEGLEDDSPFEGARILRFQPFILRGVYLLLTGL